MYIHTETLPHNLNTSDVIMTDIVESGGDVTRRYIVIALFIAETILIRNMKWIHEILHLIEHWRARVSSCVCAFMCMYVYDLMGRALKDYYERLVHQQIPIAVISFQ